MGLEAASRGWQATCVDLSRQATAVIARNARSLDLHVEIVTGDALRFVEERGGFVVVCAAPPYPLELQPLFTAILDDRPASPVGLYVLQQPSRLELRLTLLYP